MTSLRLLAVLNVLSSTPARAKRRAPRPDGPLTHFVSPRGEKCRLAPEWSNLRPAQSREANLSTHAAAGKFIAFLQALLLLLFCPVSGHAADFTQDEVGLWIAETGGTVGRNANGDITEVNLTSTWITDADLARLASLRDLEDLNLSYTWISDLGLEYLKPLENMTRLNLRFVEYISDGGIAHLKGWKHLRHLNIRGTQVTSAVFEHLAGLTTLESLDVGFSLVNDEGFESLAPLERLHTFAFGGNKLTGRSLPLLRLLPSLRDLVVSGKQRTDSGNWGLELNDFNMSSLEALTGLRSLDVADMRISDESIKVIQKLVNLETLDLSRTLVSSAGMRELRSLRFLRDLKLAQVEGIDDRAAAAFVEMEQLETLDLAETQISDRSLPDLGRMKSLQKVFVGGASVTAEGVAEFRRQHPNVQIAWWAEE